MTTIEKVKAKILDLAIRGKLVPQDPNDEPAAELLKRIRAEKEKLVKAKKIKKEKNPSEIVIGSDGRPYEKFADGKIVCIEDEIPFDIPDSWAWCRLRDLGDFVGGHTPSLSDKSNWENGTVLWVTSKDMKQKYIRDTGNKVSHKGAEELQILPPGSLLMVTRSGILRRTFPIAIAAKPLTINQDQRALRFCVHGLEEYIYCVLKGMEPMILRDYRKTGTTVESIIWEKFIDLIIPIPPLAEQKRIVVKIEELFAEVDKIATAKDGIARTVERINKKVLDLAIRGQLVPQEPNDEPAEELLKRIAEARQHNANAKARKSNCEESVIFRSADRSAYETRNGKTVCINDEIPFDIPDSWAWARLGSISDYGKCVSIDTHILPSDTWSLDLEEIEKGTGRLIERKTVGEKVSTSAKHVFKKGMVLYSKLRTYLNKVLIADVDGVCTSEIIPITLEGDILPEYLRHVLMSSYFLAYTASKDYGVKMPRVGTEDARKALIPIPPLAEQKRIVAKIEEIRTLVELIART